MQRRVAARTSLVLVVAALVAMWTTLLVVPAGASHVSPTHVQGNPTCGDFGDWTELKIEPVDSGTSSDGTLSVTISVSGGSFTWSSNIGVDAVVVKGGPNANLYNYSPEATSDSGLSAPTNPGNGEPYGLSHISVCYDTEATTPPSSPTAPPSTPPSTTPPTTPSTPPPTSAPPTSPTTPASPTSPAPTDTVIPTVLPTRHTAGPEASPTNEATPSPEDTVLPKRVDRGVLPFTGAALWVTMTAGSLLIGGGGALYLLRRRRS